MKDGYSWLKVLAIFVFAVVMSFSVYSVSVVRNPSLGLALFSFYFVIGICIVIQELVDLRKKVGRND